MWSSRGRTPYNVTYLWPFSVNFLSLQMPMSIGYSCSEEGLNTPSVRLFRDKPARTILVVCIVMTVTVVRGRYRIVLLFISHISIWPPWHNNKIRSKTWCVVVKYHHTRFGWLIFCMRDAVKYKVCDSFNLKIIINNAQHRCNDKATIKRLVINYSKLGPIALLVRTVVLQSRGPEFKTSLVRFSHFHSRFGIPT